MDLKWPNYYFLYHDLSLALTSSLSADFNLVCKLLWEVGIEAFDAYQQEFFALKVILLWKISDFLAYDNLIK